jgi:hypothetical protein
MTEFVDGQDDVEAIKLDNNMWVWVWNSPGGACHQGAKHHRRRADALRDGWDWLAARRRERPDQPDQ